MVRGYWHTHKLLDLLLSVITQDSFVHYNVHWGGLVAILENLAV